MPNVFFFDGIKGYVYDELGGQHHTPHFHAYYAEFAAEIYVDGSVKEGVMPPPQLKKIRQWLQAGGKRTIEMKWKELNEE